MRAHWSKLLCLLLSASLLLAAAGCSKESPDSKVENSSAADSSAAENSSEESQGVTESDPADMNYTLSYDSEVIPDGLAENVSTYFYAIDTQNYDLYCTQLSPLYREKMESYLQENYGYGMETSFEQYHQTLVDYAETEDFTIKELILLPASDALAEEFEEGTDFVAEYLDTYSTVFGEDFTNQLQEESTAIYDVAVTMLADDADGNEITIMNNLEMLIVETEDGFGVLG